MKQNLAHLKSVLRSKKRKKAGRKQESQPVEAESISAHGVVATRRRGGNALEELEQQIDECLTLARTEDRAGLEGCSRPGIETYAAKQ